jgi:hypothetical protein
MDDLSKRKYRGYDADSGPKRPFVDGKDDPVKKHTEIQKGRLRGEKKKNIITSFFSGSY